MERDEEITRHALNIVIALAAGALIIAAFAGLFILGSEPEGFAFLIIIGAAFLLTIALAGAIMSTRQPPKRSPADAALLEIESPQMAPPSEADVLYPDSTIRLTASEQNAGIPEKDENRPER